MKKRNLFLAFCFIGITALSFAQTTQTFSYTGGMQTFTVPSCVSQITITAYGAKGCNGTHFSTDPTGGIGGSGATVSGVYNVTEGTVLNIFVGSAGTISAGGYNGGGAGGSEGAGGGGASDVRVGGTALSDRILVAGGGGGGGNEGCYGYSIVGGAGGAGGGGNGTAGTNSIGGGGGYGGTGTVGGNGGYGCYGFLGSTGTNGQQGIGGNGGTGTKLCTSSKTSGGGGGGGYMGGGAGGGGSAGTTSCTLNDTGAGGGGAGGSSYIDPSFLSPSLTNGTATTTNGSVTITYTVNETPVVSGITEASRCDDGTVTIGALASVGVIEWFTDLTGGSPIATGSSYTTGQISSTTTYYAGANNNGCKSLARTPVNAIVNNSSTGDTTATACNSFTWFGTQYTTSGTPTHTLTNAKGCDSVVTLHLTVNYSNTGDTTVTACNSFTWFGTPYTTSGTPTHTLTNAKGCDSVVTLHLTINYSNTGDTTATACDSFTWFGTQYTTSGTPTHILTNAKGCDSLVTLHLTVNYSNTGDTTATACDSFTWFGTQYTTSGTPTHTLTNAKGCDSVVTLHLTVNYSTASSITVQACKSYTAPDLTVYTTSGIKTATIPNSKGCDSTITINLTINTVDVSVTAVNVSLTANETLASYQWLDCDDNYSQINGETSQTFVATVDGHYAVQITKNTTGCVDTSDCYTITGTGILENSFNDKINVYPNPAGDFVFVDMGTSLENVRLSVYDISGKLIDQYSYDKGQIFKIELTGYSGVYLLKVSSENKVANIRIIKN